MNIQLENWKIQNLNFELLKEEEYREEGSFGLKTNQIFSDEDNHRFFIVFEIKLEDKVFDFIFNAIFSFKVDEDITEEFKISDFPKINAPAIAFPYLRAYISNFTLQSGVAPVILPSINFTKLVEEE